VARLRTEANSIRGSRACALLDALLHQVHPGTLHDYAPRHQRDGLFSWHPDHWEQGNGALVDALLVRSGADFLPRAEATQVVDRGDHVEVGFTHEGQARRARGRAAVIATTADVAASLTDWPAPRWRQFLEATRYAAYLVVAMAGPATSTLAAFRCLVPLDGSPAAVVQQRSLDRQHAVLLSYFRGADGADLASKTDTELVELCRSRLATLGIERSALDSLAGCAVQRWTRGGTVLSMDYQRSRAALAERRIGAVFIAGDYACGGDRAGYGVSDAIHSGIRTATDLRAFLARQGRNEP
jgi:protoporphyrinogen oxidase